MRLTIPAALAASVCLSVALGAHDLVLYPTLDSRGLGVQVRFGHPGDYLQANAGRLIELALVGPAGQTRSLAGRVHPDGLFLASTPLALEDHTPGTWMLAAFYDNGFTLRTSDGRSVSTTKAEYPAAESATHNVKYAKTLLAVGVPGPGFDRVVGQRLELVPRSHPSLVKDGDMLEVQVLFEGKPLGNDGLSLFGVKDSDATTDYRTDANGVARIPMTRKGLYLLSTEIERPSRHPQFADKDAVAASLVFTR